MDQTTTDESERMAADAAEYRERRRRLREACPEGLILVRGSTEDEAPAGVRYRQNSPFLYLTGVHAPGAFLAMLPANVPASAGVRAADPSVRAILFLPPHDPVAETWSGPRMCPGPEAEAAAGMTTLPAAQFLPACIEWIRRACRVGMLLPYGPNARLTREAVLIQRIEDQAPAARFFDISADLARLRVVKSTRERESLVRAIAITAAGQEAARRFIAEGAGRYEYEVEAAVFAAFRGRGAAPGFPTIVGCGKNATILHYEENDQPLRNGELVVVDIGARLNGYSGDITRTYPVGGRFSTRQREIYGLVLETHRELVSSFQPGEDTLQSLNDRCRDMLRGSPIRARDQAGNETTMERFMPHRLGHHLGLDVHDLTALIGSNSLGIYGEDGREEPLPNGAVITMEPGLYIPSEQLGVRLEDDYLVTPRGLELMCPRVPIEIEELEAAMA